MAGASVVTVAGLEDFAAALGDSMAVVGFMGADLADSMQVAGGMGAAAGIVNRRAGDS